MVQRLVEPREQTLGGAAFAFLDAIDELACAALDDLKRTPHTQYEEGEPCKAEEQSNETDQRVSKRNILG